ncbi:MAG: hypothetical protein IJ324_05365 [Lachnospiraceae bacterium]|nr:hypothetical protein [Lachnospiraceae bacterium]
MLAFILWTILSVFFVVWGIVTYFAKSAKPFGFWANAEVAEMKDVKAYNRALGKLWCVYGILLALLGIPLLGGQNSAGGIFSILGTMLISIGAMVVYVVVIEAKYRKR